jgi:probable selenium-dependent hydroxylase accessory protein YqeC
MDLADALGLGEEELVAFIGAGGKKTAMGHLVAVARDRGLAVGYTTTTHTPPPADMPLVVEDADTVADGLAGTESPVAFASERVEDADRAVEKVRGFAPGVLSDLFEAGRFDWLFVKADGARRREFKAPGPDEPVVPEAATHLVPVASVRAVGKPLAAPTVHRPERVAAIADVDVGEEVTPATLGTVLASEEGGLKGVPDGAVVTPVVNKADTIELREQAREAVRTALARSGRLSRGLVTSFEEGYCERVSVEGGQSVSRL